jgi:hypothetical protein
MSPAIGAEGLDNTIAKSAIQHGLTVRFDRKKIPLNFRPSKIAEQEWPIMGGRR